ncbi:MAG TPA: 16S rRNA processing protein RimM, partial [Lachnospiraceae bacterium]|nr:16S rRNA processing protein RimM [Lachnospiraceae bacterium]
VYIVEHEGKEVLLPVIPDCVKDIDTEKKKVVVHIMPGLLD